MGTADLAETSSFDSDQGRPVDRSLHTVTWRRQPPVLSPVSGHALLYGMAAALGLRRGSFEEVAQILRQRYDAVDTLLTDSGTSALVIALRNILPNGGTVAYPGYACIDLTTAAIGARAQVRLYDVDPDTLSPDLDSVRRAISRGVDVIVVAHLYGYPADMAGVRNLAAEEGIPVIEDAAQGAGGTLFGARLGSLGDVGILSFGRGKGITGGSGGAVLGRTTAIADWTRRERSLLAASHRGAMEVLTLAAQRVFTHPSLYRVPASIPALRLGEMVYHSPHSPRAMAAASAAILRLTLAGEERDVASRRSRAGVLLSHIRMREGRGIAPVCPIPGGEPGFLRLAVLDCAGTIVPRADLGATRGYPMTLEQHKELRLWLLPGERAGKGSQYLRDRLFTMPTHARVDRACLEGLAEWLEGRQNGMQRSHAIAGLVGATGQRGCP